MADKEVLIDGIKMMYGTGVKGSRETSTNTTNTFDGAIVEGSKNVAHTIEIDRVSYEGLTDYVQLSNKIEDMLENPAMVTVREVKRPANEKPFVIIRNYYDCITDGDEYEIKPEEHTVENLKFKAGSLEKKVQYI